MATTALPNFPLTLEALTTLSRTLLIAADVSGSETRYAVICSLVTILVAKAKYQEQTLKRNVR